MISHTDIMKASNEIYEEMLEIRRKIHKNPELSEEEFETQKLVCECLNKWGIEHYKIASTGVVGIIRGKEGGRTIAVRGDMDALPISESGNIANRSENDGVMHACGHDIHTTCTLGVAKLLQERKEEFMGNVKLFFQPAEETVGGAKRMIEEGCMSNPNVDVVIGLHVATEVPVGTIEVKKGKMKAASNEFNVTIKGNSSHGARPQDSIDALLVGCAVVNALQSHVSRTIDPTDSVVLTVGKMNAGTKHNIIAGECTLNGIFRTLSPNVRELTKKRVCKICESTSEAYGATAEVEIIDYYPSLINDAWVVDKIVDNASEMIGVENISYQETPLMVAEDFAYFIEASQGAFFTLGCGHKDKTNYPAHNGNFEPNEECLKIGIAIEVATVLDLLSN